MRTLILFLISAFTYAQSDVPDKYWIDDSNFNQTVSNDNAFGDDNNDTIVIEFWAKFNEANCFAEWKQVKDALYYRIDIAKAPKIIRAIKTIKRPTKELIKPNPGKVTLTNLSKGSATVPPSQIVISSVT